MLTARNLILGILPLGLSPASAPSAEAAAVPPSPHSQRTHMPITTIGSYLPATQEFINHWNAANSELGAGGPMTLQGGYAVAALIAERTALENAIIAVEGTDNIRTNTASDRDIKKAALRPRLAQFRALVQGALAGSFYVRSLPRMPATTVNEAAFLRAFDDMASLWTQINAAPPAGFTAPLVLPGSYALASLTSDLAALRAAYLAANDAAQNARISREKRDILLPPIKTRLRQYRSVVIGRLPAGSALLQSIPAYSPPPGSTPDPVAVSGSWDAVQEKAVLTWQPSDNENLDYYSVRTAPGPAYRASEETAIGSVPAGDETFATAVGLAAPGSIALYRVYVVLTTANEKGSATVKVTRPE